VALRSLERRKSSVVGRACRARWQAAATTTNTRDEGALGRSRLFRPLETSGPHRHSRPQDEPEAIVASLLIRRPNLRTRQRNRDGAQTSGQLRAVGHAPPSPTAVEASRPTTEQARNEPVFGNNVLSSGYVDHGADKVEAHVSGAQHTPVAAAMWRQEKETLSADDLCAGCWASSGYSVAGCAQFEQKLRQCMDTPVCAASESQPSPR
jgi:hypothetical protein